MVEHQRSDVGQRPSLARGRVHAAQHQHALASRRGAASRGCRPPRGRSRPSRRTRSRARPTRARRLNEGTRGPTRADRARRGSRRSSPGRRARPAPGPRARPRTLQLRPGRRASGPPGAKRSSPRPLRTTASPFSRVAIRSTPSSLRQRAHRARPRARRAASPRARRPSPSAPTGHTASSASTGAGSAGASTRAVGEHVGEVHARLDRRLGVVGHHDHRVIVEERVDPAGHVHDALQRAVGLGDRDHLPFRARLVGVRVVVGQREQQEVEEVVLDEVGPHAAGVPVALAGHAQRDGAAGVARIEQVGVEELARRRRRGDGTAPPRRCAGTRWYPRARGGSGRGRSARWCTPFADPHRPGARRASCAHGSGAPCSCCRPCRRASAPRRTLAWRERGAVLDVALLAPVVPVHRGDVVLPGAAARGNRRARHRSDRREGREAIANVGPAIAQGAKRRGSPLLDRGVRASGLSESITARTSFLAMASNAGRAGRRTSRPRAAEPPRVGR